MREMLFRGKTIKDNQWIEGFFVASYVIFEQSNTPHSYIINYPCSYSCFGKDIYNEVSRDSVGQYTGYRDKNHNKIFENDIVYDHKYDSMALVIFIPQEAGWGLVYKNCDRRLGHRSRDCSDYDKDWCLEIIGNAIDNQELLNEIMM